MQVANVLSSDVCIRSRTGSCATWGSVRAGTGRCTTEIGELQRAVGAVRIAVRVQASLCFSCPRSVLNLSHCNRLLKVQSYRRL